MNADGTGQTRLTHNGASDLELAVPIAPKRELGAVPRPWTSVCQGWMGSKRLKR